MKAPQPQQFCVSLFSKHDCNDDALLMETETEKTNYTVNTFSFTVPIIFRYLAQKRFFDIVPLFFFMVLT